MGVGESPAEKAGRLTEDRIFPTLAEARALVKAWDIKDMSGILNIDDLPF